jgi:OFA family oxalate/formate antiporter-like MFS transporter
MFLNISAGLALIGSSANIFKSYSLSAGHIVFLMMLAGLFNGLFRLVFACVADFFDGCRLNVWVIITGLSILLMCFSYAIPWLIVPSIILINACYGGGFSTLPSVLSEEYDLTCLSRVHGLVLSAWGIAGLIGNNISSMLYSYNGNFLLLPLILLVMYIINFILTLSMMKIPRN